jgi:Membrane carboxypeptidase (penicillin-binding protein)
MFLKLLGIAIFAGVIFIGVMIILIQKNIPQIKSIYGQNLGGSIQYYDRTGKVLLWTDYNAINRTPISGKLMSPYIRNATVAIEDKYFYTEGALDIGGILRSAAHDILNPNGQLEGGSTITQQLVKLYEGWNSQMTIYRKIKEVFLAYDLSKEYSKATILTGYLNIVPYGGVDYGIQAAAQDYFRTSPANLSLAQSAMLAAIPQSPAYYSPRSPLFDQQALIGRKNYILSLMYTQHYITKSQEQAAIKDNVLAQVQPPLGKYSNIFAPYFVLSAKQQLESQFSNLNSRQVGWKVITTLSVPQQNEAQNLVASNLSNVRNDGGDEEALVVENVPTGQVTAQVGGTNFFNTNHGQINYANIQINPGSTFKLYDYTALINNHNAGAGSVLYDSQGPLPGYPCTNKALPLRGGNCLWDYDFNTLDH